MNQKGAAHILFLLAVVGILAYIGIASSAPFKNKLFSLLYPKPASHAAEGTRIEVVDSSGNPITSTTTQDVKVKLTYVAPTPSSSPPFTMNFVKEWGGKEQAMGSLVILQGL